MKRTNLRPFAGVLIASLTMSWAAPSAHALPPDPDNAALLYYQAFLTVANLDEKGPDYVADVALGKAPPDEKVREYIGKCREAIRFAEAARDLRVCHWGFRYSQGFEALMPQLSHMRRLSFVLVADARLMAADGDYASALDRCLMMNSVARHVNDETLISYLVSVTVRRLGYDCMRDVVGQVGDAELLHWLKDELATSEAEGPFPITALKIEREIALETMTMDNIGTLTRILAEGGDNSKQAQVLASANEQTMAEARRIYSERMSTAMAVLTSSMPYEQAHRKLAESLDPNDPAVAMANILMPALVRVLTVKTTAEAHANATRAAVDICLDRITTGRLPSRLPDDLPKDPFSGRDFEYERTAAGFVLRCQGKDLVKDTIHEFEFPVK